ncbi:DNA primase [subsurface metagenome]
MKKKVEWVNFKDIKEKVSIEELLSHYNLLEGLRRKGNELIGYCPIHNKNHFNKNSFSVNTEKNIWHCFSCDAGGNILDFVAFMEDVDIRQAGLLIKKWFRIDSQKDEKMAKKKEEKEKENRPLTFKLKNLDSNHSYLKERGLKEEMIKEFSLGYCKRGLLKGRIAIPIHNEKGELVAYAGRYPGDPPEEESKYIFPPNFKKSLILFNLNRVEGEEKELILVEGFFDVFNLWQNGFRNTVALMGSSLSKEQERLIIDYLGKNSRLTLFFDADESGKKADKEVIEKLIEKVYIKVIKLKEGIDLDSLSKKEIDNLL